MERAYSDLPKGVRYLPGKTKPFVVRVWFDGKEGYIGSFKTRDEAVAVAREVFSRRPKTARRRWRSAIGCFDDDRPWVMVELTKGREAMVDVADVHLVNSYAWYYNGPTGYAMADDPERGRIVLHRTILGLSKGDGVEVDHANRNKLDNRRSNLRHATPGQSMANQSLRRDNSSGYRGVSWHPQTQKWAARITVNRKGRHLGLYETKEEAARVRDKAALEAWGPFAVLLNALCVRLI
jgi:hypothetical protein